LKGDTGAPGSYTDQEMYDKVMTIRESKTKKFGTNQLFSNTPEFAKGNPSVAGTAFYNECDNGYVLVGITYTRDASDGHFTSFKLRCKKIYLIM